MVEGIPSSWVPSYARGLSILLVDHDKPSLGYLGSMLEQYSYKVTIATLAIDALAMLQQEKEKFKLIMASVNMPDMDTISFLRQLLRNDLPLILIAPKRSVPAAIKALGEGASFYLDKPISMDDLKYIWQHAFTNKRKRSIEEHGNLSSGETPKIAKTSNKSIIKDMLNNASTTAATRDQIKHYISLNKYKDLEPSNTPFRHETSAGCSDLKGKGKLVVEDEITKKDSRTSGNEISTHISYGNNRSNGSCRKENTGNNTQGESTGNDLLKKKTRVIWSPELHLKFISAISKVGDTKARPKLILEAMNVPGLTHRQVASHLQKFKAQVDRILKASECIDTESLRYQCSRFVSVSETLERSNALLRALENQTSRLTVAGISQTLNEINQAPAATVEAFPASSKVPEEDNFLRDFREMDIELDIDALEAFYNSTSGHMNKSDKFLESFGEVSGMATPNHSLGTNPNAEKVPPTDDYLLDFCDKNSESEAMDVTYNLDSSSTGKQPLSDFTELLNALDEEAQGLEGQATETTQGDIDRYCEILENVLIEESSQ